MSIYEKLYPWQKQLVDKFKYRNSFGLFLDCGLGKTPISLAFAEQNNCSKILIITINSKALETKDVSGSWLDWASQSNIKYRLYQKKQELFSSNEPEVLVINYEALYKRANKAKTAKVELKDNVKAFINSCKYQNVAIILDESHKTKDLQSLQTCAIMKIQSSLKIIADKCYTYLLSGTPFTTGFIDLYTQLKLLGHQGTKGEFIENFCIRGNLPGLLGWQQPIVGYKNIEALYKLIHKYAVTIKSEEVINLPEKVFVNHISKMSNSFLMYMLEKATGSTILKYFNYRHIIPSSEELKKYNENKKCNNPFYRNIDYPNIDWLAETTGSNWLRTRQLSIGFQGNSEKYEWFDRRRLDELKKFLQTNEDNYLLFYNYTPELLEIYQICEELGYNIDVYCGECKSLFFYNKYEKQTETERLTNKKNIILANFASGSTGLNWQAYSQCILFSIPLYKDYEQGIKRINRIGQKETTVYHVFYQNNWLDKSMIKALQEQVEYSNEMFKYEFEKIKMFLEENYEKTGN